MVPKLLHCSISAVPWKGLRHSCVEFEYLPEQHVRNLQVGEAWYKTAGQVTMIFFFKDLSIRHLPFNRNKKTTAQMRHLARELMSDVICKRKDSFITLQEFTHSSWLKTD
jgi:hypothetical protein